MTHREKAIELFCSGYNCAQALAVAQVDLTEAVLVVLEILATFLAIFSVVLVAQERAYK